VLCARDTVLTPKRKAPEDDGDDNDDVDDSISDEEKKEDDGDVVMEGDGDAYTNLDVLDLAQIKRLLFKDTFSWHSDPIPMEKRTGPGKFNQRLQIYVGFESGPTTDFSTVFIEQSHTFTALFVEYCRIVLGKPYNITTECPARLPSFDAARFVNDYAILRRHIAGTDDIANAPTKISKWMSKLEPAWTDPATSPLPETFNVLRARLAPGCLVMWCSGLVHSVPLAPMSKESRMKAYFEAYGNCEAGVKGATGSIVSDGGSAVAVRKYEMRRIASLPVPIKAATVREAWKSTNERLLAADVSLLSERHLAQIAAAFGPGGPGVVVLHDVLHDHASAYATAADYLRTVCGLPATVDLRKPEHGRALHCPDMQEELGITPEMCYRIPNQGMSKIVPMGHGVTKLGDFLLPTLAPFLVDEKSRVMPAILHAFRAVWGADVQPQLCGLDLSLQAPDGGRKNKKKDSSEPARKKAKSKN
jgi:hypothetical protein